MTQTMLSSRKVVISYKADIQVRPWLCVNNDRFEFCEDKNCQFIDGHAFAFDGQIFYRKKNGD